MHYAPWTFCILTFGCKVNQYESQSVREAWQRMDGAETDAPAEADVILLNTCAVTANAVTDARQAVRRLQREAPGVPRRYRRVRRRSGPQAACRPARRAPRCGAGS